MAKAIISIWREDAFDNGRNLEGIVHEDDVQDFINVLHYGEENISVVDTPLPITHIRNPDPDDPRLFRHIPL